MQTAYNRQLCLPARCMPLAGEEMTCVTGGAGFSTTFAIPGILPPIFRVYSVTVTLTLSWDGKGLMDDFPKFRPYLSKLFPISINFKLV